MGIGRFRHELAAAQREYELDLFDDFCRRQRQRLSMATNRIPRRSRLDPGGAYSLEIRGHKPAQIALESAPDEIEKRSSEVSRRLNSGYFLSGS
jgi:hypothetical protein